LRRVNDGLNAGNAEFNDRGNKMRFASVIALAWMLCGVGSAANAQIDIKGNRYLCYVVERIGGGNQVPDAKLKDQFGIGAATIMKPRYVCNPIELNGKPVTDPRMHLVCYEARTPIKPRPVSVNTQFGNVPRIELGPAEIICVPGVKKELGK